MERQLHEFPPSVAGKLICYNLEGQMHFRFEIITMTAAKMKDCRWLNPVLVGQFEFREWTPDNHLRHSRFVALRDDKKAWGAA
jgi:hypothetical protein